MIDRTGQIDGINHQDEGVATLAVALDWVLRLRDDSVSQEDLTAWLHWYDENDRHKAAFEEMQSFWSSASQVVKGPNAPSMAMLLGTAPSLSSQPKPQLRSARRRTMALAASFFGIIIVGAMSLWWIISQSNPGRPGFQRSVVHHELLPDGSRVDLAAKSSVQIQYTAQERALELEGGEAFFSVTHNRERPFIVKVGALSVRAVGTAFDVRKAGERVAVTVTEGAVEVTTSGENAAMTLRVTAGSQAIWSAGSAAPLLTPVDATYALAWRQGRLEYLNEPLSAVIADVNRYAKRPVTVQDEAIGKIAFSGTVFTEDADVWIEALPKVFAVRLTTDGDDNLILATK